jgi:hypothetical protein
VRLCFLALPAFLFFFTSSSSCFFLRIIPSDPMRCVCYSTRLMWRRHSLRSLSVRAGRKGERDLRRYERQFRQLFPSSRISSSSLPPYHQSGKGEPPVMKTMRLKPSLILLSPFPMHHVACRRRRFPSSSLSFHVRSEVHVTPNPLRCALDCSADSTASMCTLVLHSLPFPSLPSMF